MSADTAARASIAFVDESRCIGCTRCIDACPVDAIVGARQRMHSVVASLCTGCGLCVAPCPVDCIEMRSPATATSHWTDADRMAANRRHAARIARLATPQTARRAPTGRVAVDSSRRRALIDAALKRAAVRRATRRGGRA